MRTVKLGKDEFRLSEAQYMQWQEADQSKLLDRIIRQRELLAEWGLLPPPAWLNSLKETVRRGVAARS